MRRWIVGFYALFFFSTTLFAQDSNLKTLQAYRIVVLELKGNSPRISNIMDDLYRELDLLKIHTLTKEDFFWLGYRAKLEELETKQQELQRLESQLERLSNEEYPNLKTKTETKRNIKKKKKEINELVKKTPNYRIASSLPIVIESRRAIQADDTLNFQEIGVNFWIFGELVEIDNRTVFLHLQGYDVLAEEEITLYRGVLPWQNRQNVLRVALDTARERLLGRPWAAIEVRDIPAISSSVRIQWQDPQGNPRTQPLEQENLENLVVEDGRLRLHAVGFQRESWNLHLESNQRYILNFRANPSKEDDRFIQVANAELADIYLDGIHMGVAPLTIQARPGQMLTVIERDGKRPPIVYEVKEDDDEITLTFAIPLEEQRVIVDEQKSRFYFWAGSFLISFILPMIFYNLYLDYMDKVYRYDMMGLQYEQMRAQTAANVYKYTAIGTGVVSIGLLSKSVYELYRYVEISKDPAPERTTRTNNDDSELADTEPDSSIEAIKEDD